MRAAAAIFLIAAVVTPPFLRAESTWNPSDTYVLAASIIEWPKQAGLPSFTDEKRRDDDLVAQFQKSGVPKDHIIYLRDSAATHAAICNGLKSLVARTGPGSTLIFYFQGHGSRKMFACYDTDAKDTDKTELHAEELFDVFKTAWHGAHLLLLGDCCSSGSLAYVVGQFSKERPDVRVASITSATASNISTGHWTYTATLISAFAGDPRVDLNRDGNITLSEAGNYIRRRMKYEENQLSGMVFSPSFDRDFVLRRAIPGERLPLHVPGPHQVGDIVSAQDQEGKWYNSEIIGFRNAAKPYRVHFYGWDSKWDEWVGANRLRPIVKPKLAIGHQYEVQWQDGNWYLGTVTKQTADWFYYVHYESEAGDDDEWITSDRARAPGRAVTKERPQFVAAAPRAARAGDVVAAQWFHEWYRARVKGGVNGTLAVEYDDGSSGRLAEDDIIETASPNELHVGDRVLACWEGKPKMFPGRIISLNGQSARVRWEDGSAPSDVPANAIARIK